MVRRPCQRGFTLLEVVVALAVLAVALAAGVAAVSSGARTAAALQQRTYAHWVAMNRLAELQVTRQWPEIGVSTGTELLARHDWHWRMTVSATPNDFIRQVDVSVRAAPDDPAALVTLPGFLGRS
jgi:general secretion pathway protein I